MRVFRNNEAYSVKAIADRYVKDQIKRLGPITSGGKDECVCGPVQRKARARGGAKRTGGKAKGAEAA